MWIADICNIFLSTEIMKIIKSIGAKNLIFMVVITLILIFGIVSLDVISKTKTEDMSENIQAAILSAAVQCYALEGSYPPDLDYLVDNYGLILDREVYFILYEIQGSNMIPNVAVIKR